MLKAFDENNNIVFADEATKGKKYHCQCCDEYEFEGKAIIFATHGDFHMEHTRNKFSAYSCNTIIKPTDDKYYGLIYYSINKYLKILQKVASGSIIKFISNDEIENLPVIIPNDAKYYDVFNNTIDNIERVESEIVRLNELRKYMIPIIFTGQAKL